MNFEYTSITRKDIRHIKEGTLVGEISKNVLKLYLVVGYSRDYFHGALDDYIIKEKITEDYAQDIMYNSGILLYTLLEIPLMLGKNLSDMFYFERETKQYIDSVLTNFMTYPMVKYRLHMYQFGAIIQKFVLFEDNYDIQSWVLQNVIQKKIVNYDIITQEQVMNEIELSIDELREYLNRKCRQFSEVFENPKEVLNPTDHVLYWYKEDEKIYYVTKDKLYWYAVYIMSDKDIYTNYKEFNRIDFDYHYNIDTLDKVKPQRIFLLHDTFHVKLTRSSWQFGIQKNKADSWQDYVEKKRYWFR